MINILKALKKLKIKLEAKPAPKPNEPREEFVSRCISIVLDENPGMETDQAVAICNSIWEDK